MTAVSSTQKEVAADVKEYMENGNKYRGDELNAKPKSQSTKLASSELSYSTDDKIASLENKSRVDIFFHVCVNNIYIDLVLILC